MDGPEQLGDSKEGKEAEKGQWILLWHPLDMSFVRVQELHRWLSGKELACQYRREKRNGFNPWLGRSPGGGHGSCILAWRIPMDRGAWWATVHGVAKSQTRPKQLSTCTMFRKAEN